MPPKKTSGEIYESIKKLNFLGSVLYIAAHPDDENTRLISYFANNVKARTAYLSITRGDGGQNLIGSELSELLGVIRTQELLEARKIDGAEQFFTRANDFGFSKHPDETLEIWKKDEVLKDIVAVIRKFKPDIVINRFNHENAGSTHGHHTASAILGIEAFDLSSNINYKTQLKNDEIWQPKRLFFNTSWWFYGSEENFEKADKTNLILEEVGAFYPNIGLSNGEIAALSRSKHQSQGFGSIGSRGSQTEYLQFLKGDFPENKKIFDGINTTWSRVEGGDAIGKILQKVADEFNFNNPSASLDDLLEAYKLINKLEDEHWKEIKTQEIKEIIEACAGLFLEAVTNDYYSTHDAPNTIKMEIVNRSNFNIYIKSIEIKSNKSKEMNPVKLEFNKPYVETLNIKIPEEIGLTAPYWLLENGSNGMYQVENDDFIGLPETPREMSATFLLDFNGVEIPLTKDLIYKYNDPVKGETYRPFEIMPEVSVSIAENVYIFTDNKSKTIHVKIKSGKDSLNGEVSLKIPENWKVAPASISFNLSKKGEEQVFKFEVFPSVKEFEGKIMPLVKIEEHLYSSEWKEINYQHIPYQICVVPSQAKIVRLNVEKKGQLIGYINGAGDEVASGLRQLGYTVVELLEEDITLEKIQNFDAIVVGIRAYNTSDLIKFYQQYLHAYVENGGTLLVQYLTNNRLKVDEIAPFPLKLSRERVTEENAEVRILNASHELLNFPNKISDKDFEGWVQERGLYFPSEWDARFEPIFSMNDKNEPANNGSLLVTKYGKGQFIYTGLSFFRQIPEGVPGAYKLLANILSLGKNNVDRPIQN